MQSARVVRCLLVAVLVFGLAACNSEPEKKPAQTPKPVPVAEAPKPAPVAPKPVETPVSPTPKPVTVTLGKFSIAEHSTGKAGEMIRLAVEYGGKSIAQADETYRTVKHAKKDVPAGASTMVVEMFTGGANCCLGYYLLTSDGDKDAAAFIEPFDGELTDTVGLSGKVQTFTVNDSSFMYYAKTGDNASVSFTRPESPRLERLVVFDNGAWRVDKKGEYAAMYNALATASKEKKEGNATANAMSFAYYSLMAGTEKDMVSKVFIAMLPQNVNPLAQDIFADIEKAVGSFNPVGVISLQ